MSITFIVKEKNQEKEINSKEFKINEFIRNEIELNFPIIKPEAIYKKLIESGCDEEKAMDMIEKIEIENEIKRQKKINKRMENSSVIKSSCTTDYDDNELRILLNKLPSSPLNSTEDINIGISNNSSLNNNNNHNSTSTTPTVNSNNCSFVYLAWRAYNQHHHLIIKPDNIWLSIISQFSIYVKKNLKLLKDKIIEDNHHHEHHHHHDSKHHKNNKYNSHTDHSDSNNHNHNHSHHPHYHNYHHKKEIIIKTNYSIMEASFDKFTNDLTEQIGCNIKDSLRELLVPNFSTTTISDKLIFSVYALMNPSSTVHHFHYKPHSNSNHAGLPKVTLLGTLDDWKDLKDRISKLVDYDFEGSNNQMTTWVGYLLPIIDKFIDSVNGNPDINWWNRMVDRRNNSNNNNNNNNNGNGRMILSGWLSVFCIFKEDGTFRDNDNIVKNGRSNSNTAAVSAAGGGGGGGSNNNSSNNLSNNINGGAGGGGSAGNLANISAGSFASIISNSKITAAANISTNSLNSSSDSFKSSGGSTSIHWPKVYDSIFTNDFTSTPIYLTDFDGSKYHCELFAGNLSIKIDDKFKLIPSLDWFIAIENNHHNNNHNNKRKCVIN